MLNQNSEYYFLQGGGEMGKLIRAKDWSKTSLGDPEDWPQSLRTMVAFMLDNPIGMYIAWGNDYIQLYNDNYRAILDDTKHPRALGISTNETFPEVWNIVGPMFNDVMKGKPIGFPDFMLPIYRNGNVEECYFNFSYTPIRKDDGEVGGILATVIETTNKKKSEKALIESAQRFKILVRDATAAIVVLTGPEMKVEIVNEAYGRLINLKPVDLIDKPLFSVIPEAKEYYLPLLENVRKKGEMLQLYDSPYAVTVNGKLIEGFLHVVYQPYRDTDGNIIGVMAILQDVTEGVLARKKIEQSEKKFEAAIQAVEGITWTNNCKGEMIGEQLGWAQLTGQRYEEYQGYGWAKAVHPDDAQPTVDAWNKAVANKSTFVFEHRVKTKRDGLRHFSIKAVPVFAEDATIYQWVGVHTDITEQKEAAQKIKESEERFRIMADAAPNVIWALNPDGSQKYINKYAINFLGVSLQEAVSLNWQPFIHPDDLESTGKAVADAVQNKTMYTKEHRLLRHDGEYRWFLSQGAPSFFENGELYGFVGSGIDITERKETEKSLAYRTALLEAHNEASVDGILLVDAKGKIFSFNQRFIEIWNMPQHIVDANDDEAALAFSMTQLVNPKQFIDKVKYLYEHPTETSLDELEFKDGRIIERNGYPVVSEESIYYAWSWTFKDITSQKKYEKTIIDSERRFRLLADSMPQHIWTSDPEGNLNYYNQSVLDYSGLTLEQIYNEGWIKIVHPDDRDENIKEWTNSITTGKDFLFEHRFHRHDGEYRWQLSRAIPQKDENGKIQMWVGTSTDIQDQKTFTNELEKQVHNRTKELADTNIELERKNKELESFAYISSHDLQEPLRKIQTFATRILDKEYQVLSDIGKDYFKRMQDAANRMQTLIQDLLVYSRATTAERKLEITNLHKIIMEVKEDLSEVLNDKHATIETTELCEVNVIPFQFRQLMNNLIGNSLKFSNPNIAPHIKIKSEIANGINFNNPKLLHQKKYCHISVSDNGIGFDPQYSQRIFEVFQRLHGKNAYNGTGIGLSIVKKIVENHEGIITANGELDKGATFDIYIPI